MKPAVSLMLLSVLTVSVSACQVLGGASNPGDAASPTAIAAVSVTATPPDLTAIALSATPLPSPTLGSPTATPTATRTPTVTPTPIPPSAAVKPAASGLSTKLTAFRTALSAKNVDKLSAAQLALLDEADRAEQSLQGDKSREADQLREAIADIRSGAGGQTQLLDAAGKLLSQVGGGGITPTVVGGTPAKDLGTLADQLRQQIGDYQQARREKNPENLLRRQADLVTTLNNIAESTKGDDSPSTKQLRDSAASLRKALGSSDSGQAASSEQLQAAITQVQTAVGGVSATSDPQANSDNVDLKGEADSLRRTATTFRSALSSGNAADLARQQRDLLDEIGRAQSAATAGQKAGMPEAKTLADALSSLKDGAGGDPAKLDAGLAKLAEISGDQSQATVTSSVDVKKSAESLQSSVTALRKAIQTGNSADQLRLQRELYDQATKLEPQLQGDSSKEADALRGAIGAIKAGASGETTKLDEADRQLRTALGQTPTPSVARTPTGPRADLSGATGSLSTSLSALQDAVQRGEPDAIAKAKEDVRTAADKSAQTANGTQSPDADKLKNAIAAAREAAGGDPTKIQAALDLLRQVSQ